MKGVYVLLVELDRDTRLAVGKRGIIDFRKGFYAYVGSALGGLEARLDRHLRAEKKLHWHIDYLLAAAQVRDVICAETNERVECTIAGKLSEKLPGQAGFGCSDCTCPSHLFFCPDLAGLSRQVLAIVGTA